MNPQHLPPSSSDQPARRGSVAARLLGAILRLQPAELRDLCLAREHAPTVMRERGELIAGRVRMIAALFAVLTLAWIPVDAMTVDWPHWGQLMIARGVASLAFLAHAVRPRGFPFRFGPGLEVGLLIAVPLAFFLCGMMILTEADHHGIYAVSTAYFYLPFIIAAGLAIFPLTLLEAVLPAGLAFVVMVLAAQLWPHFLAGQSAGATLWRLFLITGIGTLAGMSQLRFLLRLTEQVTRDGLTNLLVRGTGEEILENQFAYAMRQDLPFAVLFIDIDRFKTINDEYGHDAGDTALRGVATQIARAFRHQDVMIRWGGEEFVVGLPGANLVNAEIAVLRLAKLGLGLRPDYQPITASIGIAERQADSVATLAQLVERADARMYEAKQAGRNRYVFQSGPKIWITPPRDKQNAA